jgi:hypothetical protein
MIDSKIFRDIVDKKTKENTDWLEIQSEVLEELVETLKT